jgi:serine/threonine protein phosphatase PrpC
MKSYYSTSTGRRDTNDDQHFIMSNNNFKFIGIFDGHGISNNSDFVSRKIKNILPTKYNNPPFDKNEHIKTFKLIQQQLLEYPESYTNGSTALLLFIYKDNNKIILNTVNLGDCRLIIVYDDNVKCITTDHKPDDVNEKKRIEELGGRVYVDEENISRICNLSVSRVFGDADSMPYVSCIPDVFYDELTNDVKFIVMACDGLWDVIRNIELPYLLKKNKGKNYAVELVKEGLKRGSTDNISVVIIEITDFNNIRL